MNVLNKIFFYSLEPFELKNYFSISQSLMWIIVPILMILVALLVYSFININKRFNNNELETSTERESTTKEYQLYFLFIGILLIIFEILLEIYSIRTSSPLRTNFLLGISSIVIYLLSKKIKWFNRNVQSIFIIIFFAYMTKMASKLALADYDDVTLIGFIVSFFFSLQVIRPIKLY